MIPQMMGQLYAESIWMRGNKITSTDSLAFQGTEQSVRRLDMESNQLTSVDFLMFNTFTQLQVKLILHTTHYSMVQRNFFEKLSYGQTILIPERMKLFFKISHRMFKKETIYSFLMKVLFKMINFTIL